MLSVTPPLQSKQRLCLFKTNSPSFGEYYISASDTAIIRTLMQNLIFLRVRYQHPSCRCGTNLQANPLY